ncbi:DJ-1/PfpI family protein [Flavonifractor sp. DFI.6.63]|uniref:DJ-1/PfpI family protein n=1 Tax=Lawsonibacter hominis TaxID=2763053 RepID=A0A8J6MFH2_9FIRM|nr:MULTISPECIES: DJ-1 family glyoxalase III [Oscillospiraceae]MBC5734823.1 DJ-1/PfpI family protein [Lawsonibacter hominis]MCI6398841.1 DJ-1/PfpI family protein [Lawsonibacter sp.]MCQ5029864.1 DJ-1/PfpI family protein [Flavonifractor sp. DFI.6.63]MDY2976422.1 DJ-1 family glyoxalase III [Oscillospiraceae bacterium]
MVTILLGDGFEEAEALVPADLLRRAGVDVTLVGLDGLRVTGGHGITVCADRSLEELDPDGVEMLVLPGGMGGVESIQMNLFALALIQRCRDHGCWLAAICAAPTILAHLGILDRRRAVCYPGMEEEMGSAVVQKGARVVADGRIITGEAAGSAFDFGLALVEALRGAEAARRVRHEVHYR